MHSAMALRLLKWTSQINRFHAILCILRILVAVSVIIVNYPVQPLIKQTTDDETIILIEMFCRRRKRTWIAEEKCEKLYLQTSAMD